MIPPAFQALNGKNVAVIIGSIQDIAVTDMAPDANILRMTSQTDLLAALENGKVDAAGGESLTLMFNKELLEKVDSVGAGLTPIPIGACYRLDNTSLQQDFNSFLTEIRRDGTYQQILDRWSNADGQGRHGHGSHQHHRRATEAGTLLRRLYRFAHRADDAKRGK